MPSPTHHSAFLIRWNDDGPQTRFRAVVQHAYTDQKQHFNNKHELLRFLWQSLYAAETAQPGEGEAR